jgi:vacuolar-type H+-ATPase subunit F/Vma7
MQHLYVIGNQTVVNLFSLAGAKGLLVNSAESWYAALEQLSVNQPQVGGVCITIDLSQFDAKASHKLRRLGVPLLFMPALDSGTVAHNSLESLMDQALGMKLMKGNNHG